MRMSLNAEVGGALQSHEFEFCCLEVEAFVIVLVARLACDGHAHEGDNNLDRHS